MVQRQGAHLREEVEQHGRAVHHLAVDGVAEDVLDDLLLEDLLQQEVVEGGALLALLADGVAPHELRRRVAASVALARARLPAFDRRVRAVPLLRVPVLVVVDVLVRARALRVGLGQVPVHLGAVANAAGKDGEVRLPRLLLHPLGVRGLQGRVGLVVIHAVHDGVAGVPDLVAPREVAVRLGVLHDPLHLVPADEPQRQGRGPHEAERQPGPRLVVHARVLRQPEQHAAGLPHFLERVRALHFDHGLGDGLELRRVEVRERPVRVVDFELPVAQRVALDLERIHEAVHEQPQVLAAQRAVLAHPGVDAALREPREDLQQAHEAPAPHEDLEQFVARHGAPRRVRIGVLVVRVALVVRGLLVEQLGEHAQVRHVSPFDEGQDDVRRVAQGHIHVALLIQGRIFLHEENLHDALQAHGQEVERLGVRERFAGQPRAFLRRVPPDFAFHRQTISHAVEDRLLLRS